MTREEHEVRRSILRKLEQRPELDRTMKVFRLGYELGVLLRARRPNRKLIAEHIKRARAAGIMVDTGVAKINCKI